MVMALFWKSKKKTVDPGTPRDIAWVRSPRNQYYNFLNFDPEEMGLKGASGVYVIWHAGLRPEWLTIGHTDNLAQTFEELGGVDEILEYDRHGNLFVTWSKIRPEFQEGVVKYLHQVIAPMILNPLGVFEDEEEEKENEEEDDIEPIPVFPPGMAPPKLEV